ncbi:MAG: acyl-CoA thioesterase [Myxococcota bacterium]
MRHSYVLLVPGVLALAFEHVFTVRFGDVDRAGIVFFARVFEYCHEAFEELLAVTAGGIQALFEAKDWGAPLVHADADFVKPMRLGERVRVQVAIEAASTKTITIAYRLLGEDEVLRATARTVHAFVDLGTFRPVMFPSAFADALRGAGIDGHEKIGSADAQ